MLSSYPDELGSRTSRSEKVDFSFNNASGVTGAILIAFHDGGPVFGGEVSPNK